MIHDVGYFADGSLWFMNPYKDGLYCIKEQAHGGGDYVAWVGSRDDCENYVKQKNAMLRKRF